MKMLYSLGIGVLCLSPLTGEPRSKVEAELSTVSPLTKEELSGSEWSWHSGGSLRLAPKGVASHSRWKTTGTWKLEKDGSVTLKGPKRLRFKITWLGQKEGRVVCDNSNESTTLKRIPPAPAD